MTKHLVEGVISRCCEAEVANVGTCYRCVNCGGSGTFGQVAKKVSQPQDKGAEMKTLAEKIEVMKAALEGKPIQMRPVVSSSRWIDDQNPDWNWLRGDYRVKPEPREWWVEVCLERDQVTPIAGWIYESKNDATEMNKGKTPALVRVREILE